MTDLIGSTVPMCTLQWETNRKIKHAKGIHTNTQGPHQNANNICILRLLHKVISAYTNFFVNNATMTKKNLSFHAKIKYYICCIRWPAPKYFHQMRDIPWWLICYCIIPNCIIKLKMFINIRMHFIIKVSALKQLCYDMILDGLYLLSDHSYEEGN